MATRSEIGYSDRLLAIRSDGTLAGWGYSCCGQINVPGGTFTAVAAGDGHSLAIRSDGTLAGWGWNGGGQINVPSGTFTAVARGIFSQLGDPQRRDAGRVGLERRPAFAPIRSTNRPPCGSINFTVPIRSSSFSSVAVRRETPSAGPNTPHHSAEHSVETTNANRNP
jgi:hypothetical protein